MVYMNPGVFTLVIAALLLFFGERLYWLFVGCIGFLVGMDFASAWMAGQPEWLLIVVAILAGIVGAVLAIFFQRVAIGLASFLAGGHFAQIAAAALMGPITAQTATVIFVVAGIIAGVVAVIFLDWALIVISALLGAAMISQWAAQPVLWRSVLFAVLFVVGASVQAAMMQSRRARAVEIS
jgi:hypothetical protein